MRAAVVEALRQRTGDRIAMPVRDLCGEYPRGAGAEEYADAMCTKALDSGMHRRVESILHQPQVRKTVVAAVKTLQLRRQRHLIDTGNLADPGGQFDSLEL